MTHAFENPLIPSLPIRQDPSTDIMFDTQEVLMERFGVEIHLHDPVLGRAYLVPTNWQIDESVDKYTSDMVRWRTHTHNHDMGTASKYLQKWNFTIEEAVAA
jgi:hypothetical protein